MEIYLIRHTQLSIAEGICYGQTDIPLAHTFEEEWKDLKNKLPCPFEAVYSSPLKRCEILARRLSGKEVKCDHRLLELNFGTWEMKKWDDIDQHELHRWMNNFVQERVPQGESFQDLWVRVRAFLEELEKISFDKVAVVTHAGVIRTIIAHILGMPLQNAFQLGLDYGRVSLITLYEKSYKVSYLNK